MALFGAGFISGGFVVFVASLVAALGEKRDGRTGRKVG